MAYYALGNRQQIRDSKLSLIWSNKVIRSHCRPPGVGGGPSVRTAGTGGPVSAGESPQTFLLLLPLHSTHLPRLHRRQGLSQPPLSAIPCCVVTKTFQAKKQFDKKKLSIRVLYPPSFLHFLLCSVLFQERFKQEEEIFSLGVVEFNPWSFKKLSIYPFNDSFIHTACAKCICWSIHMYIRSVFQHMCVHDYVYIQYVCVCEIHVCVCVHMCVFEAVLPTGTRCHWMGRRRVKMK